MTATLTFADLARALAAGRIRYVLIGVWGANFHAPDPSALFTTLDYDLFLPADAVNLAALWRTCEALGMTLQADGEPLERPHDLDLAQRVVTRRASTRAVGADALVVDLSLVMTAFDFDTVWEEHRSFLMEGVEIPVARLSHIIRSKAATNREKDRLFLATHADALRQMLGEDEI